MFPTQGSNPGLLYCRQILYCLSHCRSSYRHIKTELLGNLMDREPGRLHSMGSQSWTRLKRLSSNSSSSRASLVVWMVKNLPAMQETWVQSLGQEDPLEKGMATHSSILARRIPWTEEPEATVPPMGSQESGTNW